MNCAAISAVLRFSNLVKRSNSSEERIISFEKTKTNHDIDKLPRKNNSQITLHIICINFQVVFFENKFREFATLNAVCEEIIKLYIFIESRQEYKCIFKKELIYKRSSQMQFSQKNWRFLSLLSIFELLVK